MLEVPGDEGQESEGRSSAEKEGVEERGSRRLDAVDGESG